jgi:hypothetical protein
LGDLGIFAIKLKSADIQKAYEYLSCCAIGRSDFRYLVFTDERKGYSGLLIPYGSRFQVIEMRSFKKTRHICGRTPVKVAVIERKKWHKAKQWIFI